MLLNSTFDLEYWSSYFQHSISINRFTGLICSPIDLVVLRAIRTKCGILESDGVPSDIFILSLGEPEERSLTKVGGLPCLDARHAWPTRDGKPMTFLCQFNFSSSKELVGSLPGDLLLVFVKDRSIDWANPHFWHFEWVLTPSDANKLIQMAPEPDWAFVTCFGQRCRYWDVQRVDFARMEHALSGSLELDYLYLRSIGICRGLKIGGLAFVDNATDSLYSDLRGLRYLCSLDSLGPAIDVEFPWLNVKPPVTSGLLIAQRKSQTLNFFDGFNLSFFLNSSDQVIPYLFLA